MAEQGTETEEEHSRNERTKCVHFIAVGPGSGQPARQWQAPCGWAFGLHGGYSLGRASTLPVTCERCIELRAKALAVEAG